MAVKAALRTRGKRDMSWLLVVAAAAAVLSCMLSLFALSKRASGPGADPDLTAKLAVLDQALKDIATSTRDDARQMREDLRSSLSGLDTRFANFAQGQTEQFGGMRQEASDGRAKLEGAFLSFAQVQTEQLGAMRQEASDGRAKLEGAFLSFAQTQAEQFGLMRQEASDGRAKLEAALKTSSDDFSHAQVTRLGETNQAVKDLAERLEGGQREARDQQKQALAEVTTKIEQLTEANGQKQDAMRDAMSQNLDQLRKDNDAKLEQMRATVEEKLEGTLEKRLGESFRQVSEHLEAVHKGLGEMQTLASGVGDLRRVLTNVKSRGGWGEVQLGMLLEDMLTPAQYGKNVKIRPESDEMVEFAVRLPGKEDDPQVFLPIDAKFPHDDYERLLAAQEAGSPDEVEKASQALERAVRAQAKTVSEKYVHPPHSTDFAIIYLPTEGLFAEIIRRPGLCAQIQRQHRVMLTGPTTLAALLTSLQMGFRTLAIEKRSSEVWQVLGAAKAEFKKYGEVWDKLGKQLTTAQNTVAEAGRRTRAVEKRLRDVEIIDAPPTVEPTLLPADIEGDDDEVLSADPAANVPKRRPELVA
jgi:DNA recombination protein RmuC